jgi:hypothetical protein
MRQIEKTDLLRAGEVLQAIPFFPGDEGARAVVIEWLAKTCPHLEALEWLSVKALETMRAWGGVPALRDLLEQRFQLAPDEGDFRRAEPDDIDWNRFPSHADERALPPAAPKMLEAPAGELATIPDRPEHEMTIPNGAENLGAIPCPKCTGKAAGPTRV